jgi:hypothetical protein
MANQLRVAWRQRLSAHMGWVPRLKNWRRRLRLAVTFPSSEVLQDNGRQASRWAVHFCFNPHGQVLPQNDFMLRGLRQQGFAIALVAASSDRNDLSSEWKTLADVLIWKGMDGFDMSALQVGFAYLCQTRPGVEVLWVNDSVLGPFAEIPLLLEQCSPEADVIGFTSSMAVRPHFQSYAFFVRSLTTEILLNMFRDGRSIAFNDHLSNVLVFETCLAANLCDAGFVVHVWAVPVDPRGDLTMAQPFELIAQGFPFLKRSIIGKFSSDFDQDTVQQFLEGKCFTYRQA